MDKPLLCGKTAKDYKFWDNLMYHYKNLYPLYDKKVDFKQYTSVHDGWLFSNSKTLKLHNKVCNFEQAQATEVEKRVNLDNPDWVLAIGETSGTWRTPTSQARCRTR